MKTWPKRRLAANRQDRQPGSFNVADSILQDGKLYIGTSRKPDDTNNKPEYLDLKFGNRHGLVTFGLTGYGGGKLKGMQQHGLHVALDDMGMVESIHLCLFHWVLNDVYARINREGRYAA